ncbi:MAG: hypothetical protein ABI120_13870 [Gemmatimonadaceae bacterium]
MPQPDAFQRDVDALPPLLRALLDAELAVGNSIVRVSYTHPAPPSGACVMLANPVSTRERSSNHGLTFRPVDSSDYSGWFTDECARYFILEAPLVDAGAYPDMDAIRDAHNKQRSDIVISTGNVVLDKFQQAMRIDYEMWHDGTGYNLAVLREANFDEMKTILSYLIPPGGWRDVEALASIDSDAARLALRDALKSSKAEVRAAVTQYAPSVATDEERTDTLLQALKHGKFFDDLTRVLNQVEDFHPPLIVNALFRGLFVRPGEIATNFAAMLAFVHGKADSSFDWDHRPLFLKFGSDDAAERERAFVELCALLELDPAAVKASISE